MGDILNGANRWCIRCATKKRMAKMPKHERLRLATKASMAARKKALSVPANVKEQRRILNAVKRVMQGAKRRCENKNAAGYENYGGRGIRFAFPSVSLAAHWVLANLGPRPQNCSIDRIDNNDHYRPGNLRWATRAEQNSNRREYKGAVHGYRIANIMRLRPDYTRRSINKFILLGWSDEQIINHKKGTHVSPSVRHR